MTLKEQIMKLQTYKMYEGEDTVYVERDEVLKLLEQQPHNAEFVPSRDGYEGHVTCTNCFKIYDWDSEAQYFSYCPNCGAEMRESEDK